MWGKKAKPQCETVIEIGAREFREQMERMGHSPAYMIEQLEWLAALWGDDLPVAATAYANEAQSLRRQTLTQ